ncbi:MAG TPA: 7TM diverse intracellular signaling domain-containing protein [Chitinophagaceae bacterium]
MKKTGYLYSILLTACFTLFFNNTQAQLAPQQQEDSLARSCIDISKIRLVKSISKNVSVTYLSPKTDLPGSFSSSLPLSPGLIHAKAIPNEYVTKKAVMRFWICNSADSTVSIYFFPGFYYKHISLYRLRNDRLEEIPRILPDNPDSIGYRLISLPAHDTATILAELGFVKTYINTMRPRLINNEYQDSFVAELHSIHNDNELMTYVFCGLLLMMILFSIASFLQGANPEFLYYSGYAFFLGIMLLTKAMFIYHTTYIGYFLEGYLDFILQGLGIMFYMVFMQKYLATKSQHPFLYKLYATGIILLVIAMSGYTWFHYLTDNFVVENAIENITKVSLLLLTLIFLVYSLRHWNDKLIRYLFWGNLCLFVFSLLSQVIIMAGDFAKSFPGIFKSSLFYYEMGLFLELVFFLMALNHKNRKQLIAQARERERLKAENQMKEYEKELAVFKAQEQERERISADIHDELGSGMTAIRLMSEIARNKMKENTPVEIDKISHSADEVLNKMNAIIWSMNSGNDTLDNLVSYIRAYALEYFENTPIECRFITPDHIPPMELTGDKRRNIFLCIKETLNNALKHSKASLIKIEFRIDRDLVITVSDNGVGIDLKHIRQFGNGLKNISRRMESIGGTYEIENNNGTITTLTLPL